MFDVSIGKLHVNETSQLKMHGYDDLCYSQYKEIQVHQRIQMSHKQ